jgi:hypothetical protein
VAYVDERPGFRRGFLNNQHDMTATVVESGPAGPAGASPHYENGKLYYVKARSGDVSVARYFARHNLFYAVGDAIGYFPGDLAAIGKPVQFDGAFDD